MTFDELFEDCWQGYRQAGMKKKGNRMVPNCVPVSENTETPELTPGEYFVWVAHFDDGSSKRVKVTDPKINLEKYYANKGKVVVKVDYDYTVHHKS